MGTLAAVAAVLLGACKKDAQETPETTKNAFVEASDVIPGHYLVLLKEGSSIYSLDEVKDGEVRQQIVETRAARVMSGYGVANSAIYNVYGNAVEGFAVKMNEEQAQQLKKNPEVLVVEPDRTIKLPDNPVKTTSKSGSASTLSQTTPWGVTAVGGAGGGSGITAWIVDTGVDLDHPDLTVDRSRSRSFLPNISSPDDQNGHGTHVAGTINAKNNDLGVVGIAPNSVVVSLRVLDANGSGSFSNSVSAFDYIASKGKAGDVVNYSVGPQSRYTSNILDNAVKNIAKRGIKFVMAAGNSSDNTLYYSPARLKGTNIFVVSAVNSSKVFASFSNWGSSVTYAAPGVDIVSTYKDGQYAIASGTSMASPHVAGILAAVGRVVINGYATGDPDGVPDPIAHR